MKVRVPIFVQDRLAAVKKDIKPIEHFDIEDEEFFLDGPITRNIAILDLDSDSGELHIGTLFKPPNLKHKLGRYEVVDENNLTARDLNCVCAFAAVKKAMEMFEEPDTLGRKLVWAFNSPQLLVVPRAGSWANAYYERASHSLQFFYFEHPQKPGETVYTSQSRDIVAHEAGHAILDGIAPQLYNAVTPQSLALHEGVADLVAVLTAFRSPTLREAVLNRTGGSIEKSTEFSAVAEEFGSAVDKTGLAGYLRNLYNQKTLDPTDHSFDATGRPNFVNRSEPHELCQVLTGALYQVIFQIHNNLKKEYAQKENRSELKVSGKALGVGAERFKRIILRALDYLPPGEVSFADYGRAILASDLASHPDDDQERQVIRQEFIHRKMVLTPQSLEVETNFDYPTLKELNLQNLIDSDWMAYEFANQNRELLYIPADIPFQVEPRLKVTKLYYHHEGKKEVTECLFKVWWNIFEVNQIGNQFPKKRQMSVGTTLAIDWITHQVRARITSDRVKRPNERDEQCKDRDVFLRAMVDQGILVPERTNWGQEGKDLRSEIAAVNLNGVMQIRNMARMLHIIER